MSVFLISCSYVKDDTNLNEVADTDDYNIINAHEHIQSFREVPKYLTAMEKAGIVQTYFVGSPRSTIYGGEEFSRQDENNKEILEIKKGYPKRTEAFCTIDPRDPEKLNKFKHCMNNGSVGLKLYNGHYALFYKDLGQLNRTEMDEIYAYCEDNDIPILYHINPGKENLLGEFESILKKYPNLRLNCPHFCLSSINLDRLKHLFDAYPNLYTDISFGFFVEDGLNRISKNVSRYRNFVIKYHDRFMFGTDMVVTSNKRKTVDWIYNLTMCYRDMLEAETYDCNVGEDISGSFNGLDLDEETLKTIYEEVPKKFLYGS